MMKPSLTGIGIIIFFLFLARSIWSFYTTWQSPNCTSTDTPCFHSFLNANPKLALLVYISDSENSRNLSRYELVLHIKDFDYRNSYEKDIEFTVPEKTKYNGTLYIHSIFFPTNKNQKYPVNDLFELRHSKDTTYLKGRLSKYAITEKSKISLKDEIESYMRSESSDWNFLGDRALVRSHLRTKYIVLMCTEELHLPGRNVPVEIIRYMKINSKSQFLPLATPDFLNMRLKDLQLISWKNEHPYKMTFKYIYNPVSLGKIRFLLQMETTLLQFLKLGFSEKDLDEVKGVFADTNLYLLCATMCIGSVHLLLDLLSFKNDVSFWRTHKSMAGLSTRTVLWRTFSQIVIFLYLMDGGTSLLVLIPAGISTLIELWKVTKVYKTRTFLIWNGRDLRFDQHHPAESIAETQTRKYDEECMKYLSYVLYPLCVGSAIYSLIYQPHKSFYSWTISSLVNGVYAFGFLFMFPQLFINYRLKSVAALPWRAFTYKALNTFIDDIFAFIITMPTAHRVACFRDDIVFLIYLYQRWLYPVDNTRIDDVNAEISSEASGVKDEKKEKDE